MTAQHPAAPETETDANGLTEWAARFLVQCGPCDAGLPMPCACTTEDERPLIAALLDALDAARERVRVVEGERDAARVAGLQWCNEARDTREDLESAEAAHEAEKAAHERLRAEVQTDLELLAFIGCRFFACEGPDHEPEDMVTCRVCWRMREIRALLAGGGAQ